MQEIFMQRALELAQLGFGFTKSNPMVGCVIVHNGFIIGEGYHQKYGEAHAEVNAINSVENKDLITEADIYITLEPCSHFGKTPPCADLLIKYRPKNVFISNLDPNPLVAGNGIEKLKKAGIPVKIGLLTAEGRNLNKRFFTFQEKKRPYIILKWAETADGFVANPNGGPLAISDSFSQMINHKWRTQEMAILVGAGTLHADNPQLTARKWKGENPQIIVLDEKGNLTQDFKVFEQPNTLHYKKPMDAYFMEFLFQQNINSIIIEGGPKTHQKFINQNLFDEIRIFKSPIPISSGIKAATLPLGLKRIESTLISDKFINLFQPF